MRGGEGSKRAARLRANERVLALLPCLMPVVSARGQLGPDLAALGEEDRKAMRFGLAHMQLIGQAGLAAG